MPQKTLTNPNGAFAVGTAGSFILGLDNNGSPIESMQTVCDDLASAGVITRGMLVNMVPPTSATVAPQWKANAAAGADSLNRTRGIALTSTTAAGQPVKVCVYGFCHVWVNAGTAAADSLGVPGALAGEVDVIAGPPTAATISGQTLGTFMGVKQAGTNLAWFFFDPR